MPGEQIVFVYFSTIPFIFNKLKNHYVFVLVNQTAVLCYFV